MIQRFNSQINLPTFNSTNIEESNKKSFHFLGEMYDKFHKIPIKTTNPLLCKCDGPNWPLKDMALDGLYSHW